jgi:hypothetical protein
MWQDLCALVRHPEHIAYALERAHGRHWLPQELQARQEALWGVFQNPAVDGRMVDRHAAFLHHLLQVAIAQGIRHIPSHARQDNISLEMGPLKAHHDRSPPLRTLGRRGRSYPISLANENLRQIRTNSEPFTTISSSLPSFRLVGSRPKPPGGWP